MAETTGISWCDATWNPHFGCRRVSSGCRFCYADRDMTRRGLRFGNVTRSKTTFDAPLKWHDPKRIFVCSWSDLFIQEADAWRSEVWDIIRRTPHHTFLCLTKRPRRIARHLPPDWGTGYPNVWLGVSAEDQDAYDKRWPVLAEIPAVVRWISAEPLLGPIENLETFPVGVGLTVPGWMVVGGESGPEHRPMNLDWARELRNDCENRNIPYFFKQVGGIRRRRTGAFRGSREPGTKKTSLLFIFSLDITQFLMYLVCIRIRETGTTNPADLPNPQYRTEPQDEDDQPPDKVEPDADRDHYQQDCAPDCSA